MEYLIVVSKSIAIYIFIIIAIRLFGKKELSQLSVIDLVFILLIANSVQNAMVGQNTSLLGGMFAALGLFICNFIFRFFLKKYSKFNKIVQGEPIILAHNGSILQSGLKHSGMTVEEVEMAVREHSVENISKTNLIVLEIDGNISVLTDEFTTKTTKKRKKPQLQHNP